MALPLPPSSPLALLCKPKAFLMAVPTGFGGYGDFLFGLKLLAQLKQQYAATGAEIPPVYLVTHPGRQ